MLINMVNEVVNVPPRGGFFPVQALSEGITKVAKVPIVSTQIFCRPFREEVVNEDRSSTEFDWIGLNLSAFFIFFVL